MGGFLHLLAWKLEAGNSGLKLPAKPHISQDADLNNAVLLVQNQIFPSLYSVPTLAFAASAPSLPNLPFSLCLDNTSCWFMKSYQSTFFFSEVSD